ncbi:WecB/TagA/CpsF family glycosyltransferase [Agaribacter marinus]|nr:MULTISPECIES: WecB/TagA/CpsF family glycosyltransferase [Bacillaceae]NAZ08500.1 WecB/TagA/CpsF family glycosyltransferase [Agaribacter marinus]WBX81949.1 WecB/TagA/CpsF family glycosyltransferase [Virgibacillus salarius]
MKMDKKLVKLMDIPFINIAKKDLLNNNLYPSLDKRQKCYVVTANPEIVMKTREDASYKKMVKKADYIVPDGAGIVMASKLQKEPIQERVAGYDLMLDLLAYADKHGLSCYFLGAKEHVNEKLVSKVKEKYPDLTLAGHHHGYFSIDDPSIVNDVANSNPDLIFVALGSPRQEAWITQHMDKFTKGLFMGVGGSFDVLAGEVKRAPEGWINLNLEWLYRLLKQPFRWRRILKAVEFMVRIFLKKK